MVARPLACVRRCCGILRHASTAASSRKNDSDRILPFSVRLSNRSTEIKPSMVSRIGFNSAARSRYSCLCSGLGQTSKITAIILRSLSFRDASFRSALRYHLTQECPLFRQNKFVLLGEIKIGDALGIGPQPRPVGFIGGEI